MSFLKSFLLIPIILLVKCDDDVAILIVGGEASEKSVGNYGEQSVEALRSDGTPLCKMPDLPDNRADHTMDGDILCGGYYTRTSCLHYGSEGWTKYGWNLQQKRSQHLTWRRPDDSLQIMGGSLSPKTSEIVTSGGSRIGFDLKYKTT